MDNNHMPHIGRIVQYMPDTKIDYMKFIPYRPVRCTFCGKWTPNTTALHDECAGIKQKLTSNSPKKAVL